MSKLRRSYVVERGWMALVVIVEKAYVHGLVYWEQWRVHMLLEMITHS